MIWTTQDIQQFKELNISVDKVTEDLKTFRRGLSKQSLERAATIGDGISVLKPRAARKLVRFFEDAQNTTEVVKFVPASGAATRMFKPLLSFLEASEAKDFSFSAYLKSHVEVSDFIKEAHHFPFHDTVLKQLPADFSFDAPASVILYLKALLQSPGLNLGNKPKALLPFHKNEGQTPLVLEEHILEALHYAKSKGTAQLHFTISEGHLAAFNEAIKEISASDKFRDLGAFNVQFSHQKTETDTLVVGLDLHPLRDNDGRLVFHPAGHGALLDNLAALQANVIFIKNVDNVCAPHGLETSLEYKKILGGKLLQVQQQMFAYTEALDSEIPLDATDLAFMVTFFKETFSKNLPEYFEEMALEEQRTFLLELFHRPIRVCGMVENEGKTGGGPFWIKDSLGQESLQIIEASQVAVKDPEQLEIFEASTHFNPVDIVCGIKNYKGETFDLTAFNNPSAAFIAEKNRLGKRVKVLELPGLWNGGMWEWNSIFIEIPKETFTPVKTVLDLLDPGHMPG